MENGLLMQSSRRKSSAYELGPRMSSRAVSITLPARVTPAGAKHDDTTEIGQGQSSSTDRKGWGCRVSRPVSLRLLQTLHIEIPWRKRRNSKCHRR